METRLKILQSVVYHVIMTRRTFGLDLRINDNNNKTKKVKTLLVTEAIELD